MLQNYYQEAELWQQQKEVGSSSFECCIQFTFNLARYKWVISGISGKHGLHARNDLEPL